MSDFRYEIKTSLPVIWLETLTQKKSGLVRTQTNTNNDQLILVDPVEDEEVEEIRPRTDPPNVLQCAI
jgi:hypothetical protein